MWHSLLIHFLETSQARVYMYNTVPLWDFSFHSLFACVKFEGSTSTSFLKYLFCDCVVSNVMQMAWMGNLGLKTGALKLISSVYLHQS